LEATEKTQQPFLKRAIKDKFIEEKLNDTDFIVHIQNLIIQSTSVSGSNIDKAIPTEFLYELANFLNNEGIRNLSLIALLRNGCWVFSVASKNIDQKAAFSIVDFEIGSLPRKNLTIFINL
jgi:hypothetical protein